MKDIEGIEHEIECAIDLAHQSFVQAKDSMRAAEAWSIHSGEGMSGAPLKMAAKISEVMAQLDEAHKFLSEAANMRRQLRQQEAAA